MADEESGETMTKGQQYAVNIGIGIRLVKQGADAVGSLAGSLERIKNLFKPFERQGQQSMQVVGQAAAQVAGSGGGGGGGGGGMAGLAAVAAQFNAITTAASTIWNAVTPMMGLASAAENTRNTIAGTFVALGHAGDINAGLDLAATTLERIRRDSAALPGEAQEYVQVFQSGLPNLSAAFSNNMDQMLGFSNQFAAIGRSLGVDAQQIGNDLARLTQEGRGGAGMDVTTFVRMMPFINSYRESMHQAAITTESFNAMTQQQRVQLLQNSFGALSPMIDQASNSYDALSGAISSNIQRIQLAAFEPIFEGVKIAMRDFSNWLDSSADGIISVARLVTTEIGGAIKGATMGWRNFASEISGSTAMTMLGQLGSGLGIIAREVQGGGRTAGGAATMGAAVLGGPLAALLAGGFGEFLKDMEAVEATLALVVSAFNNLTTLIIPLSTLFGWMNEQIGIVMSDAIPAFAYVFQMFSIGVSELIGYVTPIFEQLRTVVEPVIAQVSRAFGSMVNALGDFLLPLLRAFGITLRQLWEDTRAYVIPFTIELGNVLRDLFDAIGDVLRLMGRDIQAAVDRRSDVTRSAGNDAISRALAALTDSTQENTAAQTAANTQQRRTPPAQRGGNRTHNDFRNSRFDITQQFAEGFDPDRVGVAFVDSLEAAATQRIDAGLNPLFSVS